VKVARETPDTAVAPWVASTLENALGGSAISVGVLGITRGGRDLVIGLGLVACGVLLLLRGASLNRPAGSHGFPPRLRLSRGGRRLVQAGTIRIACLALAGVALVLIDAARKAVSYASANDGLDPARTRCADDARPIGNVKVIRAQTARQSGHSRLGSPKRARPSGRRSSSPPTLRVGSRGGACLSKRSGLRTRTLTTSRCAFAAAATRGAACLAIVRAFRRLFDCCRAKAHLAAPPLPRAASSS
jgi:hypothetical protein